MQPSSPYDGREASLVKHIILKNYLQRLTYILGNTAQVLNYIDGFAGPWQARDEALSDTSPHVAMNELRRACQGFSSRGRKPPQIRCLFIEKSPTAFQALQESVKLITDIEVKTLQGEFEQHVPAVMQFSQVGQKHFTLYFIDPTGWTGFGLGAIKPLLQNRWSEMLINFMTKDIQRFVDSDQPGVAATFQDLFGDTDYRLQWRGLTEADRTDAIVKTYCDRIKSAGVYEYVVSAVVLHPTQSRAHYHLIYATSHPQGLITFREVEAKSMQEQEKLRAQAQQTQRETRSGMSEMFPSEVMGADTYYVELRDRHLTASKQAIMRELASQKELTFDDLAVQALTYPMTWMPDVKDWIEVWKQKNLVQIVGLAPKARKPQYGEGHRIKWTGPIV